MSSQEGPDFWAQPELDSAAVPSAVTGDAGDPASRELQRVWLAAQACAWRSMALVPACEGVDVIRIAHAFAALGSQTCGESVGVADLRDVPFSNLRGPVEIIRWHIRGGERVIIALRACAGSVTTVPLVRASDCAILCVSLGTTRIAEASDILEQVGRDRFIGTLLVRSSLRPGEARSSRAPPRLLA